MNRRSAAGNVLRRVRQWLRPGAAGERLASRLLEARGWEILARNYQCRLGEIDLIARDGDALVFVEVKERHGAAHGLACETVPLEKRRRIVRAARLFAAQRGLSESHIRFDVVSVDWDRSGSAHTRHDQAAFDADGR